MITESKHVPSIKFLASDGFEQVVTSNPNRPAKLVSSLPPRPSHFTMSKRCKLMSLSKSPHWKTLP